MDRLIGTSLTGAFLRRRLPTLLAGGLHGAARDWAFSQPLVAAEQIVDGLTGLLAPLVHPK